MAITQNTYTGNGSTVLFSFTFPYLETTDVKVSLNGTVTTAYTFANATTIQFNTAPANGVAIRIYRETDDSELSATFYPGSAIRSQDLNDNFTQNLYVTQEVNNNSVNIDGSNPMVGPLNMNGFQITNLPVPAVDTNAATKKYVDDRFGNLDIPGHTRWRKVATASQTIFSGPGDYGGVLAYSPTREQVYINGALQQRGVDYAADNGTSVVFTVGLTVGDVVDIICVNNLTNSAVSNAANITYSGQFTGQTARTVAAKLGEVVSVLDFGADPTGQTNSTAAIQAAINAVASTGGTVHLPAGTYKVSSRINLVSKLGLIGDKGAIIKSTVAADYCLQADNATDITIQGLTIEGNDASYSNVHLNTCERIHVTNCHLTKAGAHGIYVLSSSFVVVDSCELSRNYYYGVEDKLGTRNKYSNNRCYLNGNTGTATSTGGRGINIWMATDCVLIGNSFINNTEYGSRIYSQAGDSINSTGNRLIGNYYSNNDRADLVLYDETGGQIIDTIISSCILRRTTNTALGVIALLSGHRTKVSDCIVVKEGAFGTDIGYQFTTNVDSSLTNCYVKNLQYGFTLGGSTNSIVSNFYANGVAVCQLGTSTNCTIKDSRFIHGGPGASDICFNAIGVVGPHKFINNYFDGFFGAIYLVAVSGTTLQGNETVNSGLYGLRLNANAVVANINAGGNKFDSAFIWEAQALSGSKTDYGRHVTYYNTAPANLTWSVGDICYNSAPAVGQPKGWVCTVAGNPGTWVSLGNL